MVRLCSVTRCVGGSVVCRLFQPQETVFPTITRDPLQYWYEFASRAYSRERNKGRLG
jgi:hypothetical protein